MNRCAALAIVLGGVFSAAESHAAWLPGGSPVCTAPGFQGQPIALPVPAGGIGPSFRSMIVFWTDTRNALPAGHEFYFDVVDPLGPDGVPANGSVAVTASGFQLHRDACVTGTTDGHPPVNGGAIIAWSDARDDEIDIFARRVLDAPPFNAPWPIGGVPVCTAPGAQGQVRVVGDADAGATLAWFDERDGLAKVYAQRLDANGVAQWAADGVVVCDVPASRFDLRLLARTGGDVYVGWIDARGGPLKAFLARIGPDGAPAPGWPVDGLQVSSLETSWLGPLVPDDDGGVFLSLWSGGRPVVCRIDGDAGVHTGWPADGVLLTQTSAAGALQDAIAFDGGVVVSWAKSVDPEDWSDLNLLAQRLLADGTRPPGWGVEGNSICDAPGIQYKSRLVQAPAIISVWEDLRPGAIGEDLYAMRLRDDGSPDPYWTANGVPIATGNGRQRWPSPVWDGLGGVMIAYSDDHDFNSPETDVYAQIVNFTGRVEVPVARPAPTRLAVPFPNPARSGVTLELSLANDDFLRAEVHDALGRRVRRLDAGGVGAGPLHWDLSDEGGRRVEPGIYFMRVRTTAGEDSRPVIVRR